MASAITEVILGTNFAQNILSFFSACSAFFFFFPPLHSKNIFFTIHVSFHKEYWIITHIFLFLILWLVTAQAIFFNLHFWSG